jgi:hypothetical protein
MYNPARPKSNDINSMLFDDDDFITYEDILKNDKLSKEDRERFEKLKLDRDRKLIQDKLNNLKLKSKK